MVNETKICHKQDEPRYLEEYLAPSRVFYKSCPLTSGLDKPADVPGMNITVTSNIFVSIGTLESLL